jgi:hypothetical protein
VKINSSYKAWENQQYLYGLGPTYTVPITSTQKVLDKILVNWAQACLLQWHKILCDVFKAHHILTDFVCEFEDLYVLSAQRVSHSLCLAETAIGNLGWEIRKDCNIYANLTQWANLGAQVN